MLPEHLVNIGLLAQWYKHGFTDGHYAHMATANVKVSEVEYSSHTILSAPTLLDLLNDDNVAPTEAERDMLEEALYNSPDPYDLDETARFNEAIDDDAGQTGQVLAGLLNWPQATQTSKVEILQGEKEAKATTEIDGGLQELKCKLPLVLTTDLRSVLLFVNGDVFF